MEKITKDVYMKAQASILKDSNGNYILPKTTTGLVTNLDGKTIDELLAERPLYNDMERMDAEISLLRRKVDNLDLKVKHTNAVQDLRNDIYIIGRDDIAPEKFESLDILASDLIKEQFSTINEGITNLSNRVSSLESINIEKEIDKLLNSKINKVECEQIVDDKLEIKTEDIREQLLELHTIANDSKKLFNSALLTIIELYEFMMNMNSDTVYPDMDRIVKIYKYLFDNEEITEEKIPENIWLLIEDMQNAELIAQFLKL